MEREGRGEREGEGRKEGKGGEEIGEEGRKIREGVEIRVEWN